MATWWCRLTDKLFQTRATARWNMEVPKSLVGVLRSWLFSAIYILQWWTLKESKTVFCQLCYIHSTALHSDGRRQEVRTNRSTEFGSTDRGNWSRQVIACLALRITNHARKGRGLVTWPIRANRTKSWNCTWRKWRWFRRRQAETWAVGAAGGRRCVRATRRRRRRPVATRRWSAGHCGRAGARSRRADAPAPRRTATAPRAAAPATPACSGTWRRPAAGDSRRPTPRRPWTRRSRRPDRRATFRTWRRHTGKSTSPSRLSAGRWCMCSVR